MSGPIESPDETDLDVADGDLQHAAWCFAMEVAEGPTVEKHDALREHALKYAAAVCRALGDAESNQWTFCAKLLDDLAADYGDED